MHAFIEGAVMLCLMGGTALVCMTEERNLIRGTLVLMALATVGCVVATILTRDKPLQWSPAAFMMICGICTFILFVNSREV